MTRDSFSLPPPIGRLVEARNQLRDHYRERGLKFTLDGNLVGDLGEAVAAEMFGIDLSKRNDEGVDGMHPSGVTVQIKSTGTGRGPAFRPVKTRAHHLLFFDFDFDRLVGSVAYNGPEHLVVALLPPTWQGQRLVSRSKIDQLHKLLAPELRLDRVDQR